MSKVAFITGITGQNGACLTVMPTNLYDPGDNYHPESSHVIPALIRKFHEAKQRGDREVVVWGSGTPRKLMSTARLNAMGWRARVSLAEGLAAAYKDFQRSCS